MCAIADCGNPSCPVCTVSKRFEIVVCQGLVDEQPCKYVAGHRGPCVVNPRAGKVENADLKESKPVPDLSGERAAATSLAFVKRTREGAFRQQRK